MMGRDFFITSVISIIIFLILFVIGLFSENIIMLITSVICFLFSILFYIFYIGELVEKIYDGEK